MSGPAFARPDIDLSLGNALDVPAAGRAYTALVDESYTASLRLSANFKLADNVTLGPSVEVDGQPVNSDESTLNATASAGAVGPHRNAKLGRARGLGGVKLTVRGEYMELWVTVQGGVDYIGGKVVLPTTTNSKTGAVTPAGPTVNVHSIAGVLAPEIALVVPIKKRGFVGLALSTPVSWNHRIAPLYANTPPAAQPATPRGNAVDLQLGIIAGVRL